jgi:hypothetical protein
MNSRNEEKWKPGVPKSILLLTAGLMWIGVGVMLNTLAYFWLRVESASYACPAAGIGVAAALLIHHLGFLRVVDKNLARILPMQGKRCVFAFMPWKSYILILLMISAGYFLRHSPVPKKLLAILYIAIGTALFLSSIRYLRYLVATLKQPGE